MLEPQSAAHHFCRHCCGRNESYAFFVDRARPASRVNMPQRRGRWVGLRASFCSLCTYALLRRGLTINRQGLTFAMIWMDLIRAKYVRNLTRYFLGHQRITSMISFVPSAKLRLSAAFTLLRLAPCMSPIHFNTLYLVHVRSRAALRAVTTIKWTASCNRIFTTLALRLFGIALPLPSCLMYHCHSAMHEQEAAKFDVLRPEQGSLKGPMLLAITAHSN